MPSLRQVKRSDAGVISISEDDLNKIETVVGYLEPLLNDIDWTNSGKWHFMRDVIDEAEDWISELRTRANVEVSRELAKPSSSEKGKDEST